MSLLLVRHGSAGSRKTWRGDDRARPLDRKGRSQAQALVETLGAYPIDRLVTSPYLRCLETMMPLAQILGIEIEQRSELAEGEGASVNHLLEELAAGTVVACTHRDVIASVIGAKRKAAKGSTWVLETADGKVEPMLYLRPGA